MASNIAPNLLPDGHHATSATSTRYTSAVARLGAVTVAEVTGTAGPASTHVEVPPEAGLTGRDRSWVNVTGLHTVSRGKLRRRRGHLAPIELDRVGAAIRLYVDVEPD